MKKKRQSALEQLLAVMARLRAPNGCPWDRAQDHRSLRFHAIEEVYELLDAIEAGDDHEMAEELGDLLMQVVFHAQMAKERGAFDFDAVCRLLVEKLIRRHPHVFGKVRNLTTPQAVWAQWDQIKKAEKAASRTPRHSALDGIPKHLPALLRAEKLLKKARKAELLPATSARRGLTQSQVARRLFALAAYAQVRHWSAEALLRAEARRREREFRRKERTLTSRRLA
jgi:XTP/dITP diphosphohydrolase